MMRATLRHTTLAVVIVLLCLTQRVVPSAIAQLPPGSTVEPCTAECPCDEPNDPDIRVVLRGRTATGGSPPPTYVDPGREETFLTDPQITDIGGNTNTGIFDGFQRMVLEFEAVVASPGATTVAAARPGRSPWQDVWSMFVGPALEAAQARQSAAYVLFTSLGESQGTAFTMQIVNTGRRPLRLAGNGLVVEPLKQEAARAAQRQLANFRRGITTTRVNAYCIDEALAPPNKGMIFKLAPAATQRQFAGLKDVLRAGRIANVTGQLHPDSNPAAYADFIQQWSVWTSRERWNESAFANKLVEHTRKRIVESGRAWTADAERTLRGAAPGRWRDIASVLEKAKVPAPAPR